MTKSYGNCGKIVHRLCSSCISSIGNLTGTPLSSPCYLRLEVVLRCLSLSPYRYDYRFTCTCIGFFYVKYTEPIYQGQLGHTICQPHYAKSSSARGSSSSKTMSFKAKPCLLRPRDLLSAPPVALPLIASCSSSKDSLLPGSLHLCTCSSLSEAWGGVSKQH